MRLKKAVARQPRPHRAVKSAPIHRSPVAWRSPQLNDSLTVVLGGRGKPFRVIRSGAEAFWISASGGRWDPETFRVFDRFLSSTASYIDVGSWIGPTLLYGCQLARAAYGIEPDPVAYAELRKNIQLNASLAANVNIYNVCIATTSGSVKFGSRAEGGDSMSSLLFADQGKTVWNVAALRFEDFVKKANVTDCSFIKIDIEGGEYQLLSSIAPWLNKCRPTLYLSFHPCFLFRPSSRGWVSWSVRTAYGFLKTFSLLRTLRFYYDACGGRLTTLRTLRLVCRGTFPILATDEQW